MNDSQHKIYCITQPSFFKSYFEFRNGTELLGILYYPKKEDHTAIAETENGIWEFNKENLLKFNLGIYEKGKELPYSKYYFPRYFKRNIIELPKGERLIVEHKDFRYIYDIYSENKRILLRIKRKFSIRENAKAIVYDENKIIGEYPWLTMLLMHIAIKKYHTRPIMPA